MMDYSPDALSEGLVSDPSFKKKTERIASSYLKGLSSVNWDFPNSAAQGTTEGLHPYPAKFIAEIPGTLIDQISVLPGTTVLDPFCGSGTTLVECQRRGIASVGVDLNPIACLMARVRTASIPAGVGKKIVSVMAKARSNKSAPIPEIPNLDHWFQKHVQDALASLSAAISEETSTYRDIFRLALSSIIVRVSNQDSDTRYAAVSKKVSRDDVFLFFERAAYRVLQGLSGRDYLLAPATVIEADTLDLTPDKILFPVGLVITSPPYPNAYEYWLYHKYRMWWLGFDPIAVKQREIGARAHFFKTNHHTADNFVHQMRQTFDLLRHVIVPGGHACFVVGRSKIHGAIIDNAEIITSAGKNYGFTPIFRTERAILANRKSFNLSHANIKTETILVLRSESA